MECNANDRQARRDWWGGMSYTCNGVDRGSRRKYAHGQRHQLGPRFLTVVLGVCEWRELDVSQEKANEARVLCGVVKLHMADTQKYPREVRFADWVSNQVLVFL